MLYIAILLDIATWISSTKILLGTISAFIIGVGGYFIKKSSDKRKNESHAVKIKQDMAEIESEELKTSQEAIENLRKNIHRLNELWVQENSLRTKAEAAAIRKTVALDLVASICPKCYEQIPKELKKEK